MTDALHHTDILILGAGPVGMALARALAGSRWHTLIIDQRPRGAWATDPRALAVSHGSRQLLSRLGAWDEATATAIREIHVSQRGGPGRTFIEAKDYAIPALGYVVRYSDLAATLDLGLTDDSLWSPCTVEQIETGSESLRVSIKYRCVVRQIATRLVVHAEGAGHDSPELWKHDYGQQAVIAEVRSESAHNQRAWERFTPEGPLALLPLGQDYSLVMAVPTTQAEALLQLNDDRFLAALHTHFGGQRLNFLATGPRTAFPLVLRARKNLVQPRQVWIGNSAQTLHPVTGQGFNLGLRDAWELAEALFDTTQNDPGYPELLSIFARKRQLDRLAGAAFTDGIVRLFSNDLAPLRTIRGLGMLSLDLVPPLRDFVARRMIWGARAWP